MNISFEPYVLLGYTWRSYNHFIHFQTSIFFLVFVLLCQSVIRNDLKIVEDIAKRQFIRRITAIFVFIYIAISISAVIRTEFGRVNGNVYSVDCIWFNALIACIILAGHYFIIPERKK